jgi:DNA-binding response OmpR family regulator
VLIGHNGAEALSMVWTERPDSMLLDLKMPSIPGWKSAAGLKPTSPILIITGFPPSERKASHLAPDADDSLKMMGYFSGAVAVPARQR